MRVLQERFDELDGLGRAFCQQGIVAGGDILALGKLLESALGAIYNNKGDKVFLKYLYELYNFQTFNSFRARVNLILCEGGRNENDGGRD